jgi:hypothetical protein
VYKWYENKGLVKCKNARDQKYSLFVLVISWGAQKNHWHFCY